MKLNDQPRQVFDYLRKNRGVDFCDDCLGTQTRVDRHHINTIVSTLALFPKEFVRQIAACPQSSCQSVRQKLVTRAV